MFPDYLSVFYDYGLIKAVQDTDVPLRILKQNSDIFIENFQKILQNLLPIFLEIFESLFVTTFKSL